MSTCIEVLIVALLVFVSHCNGFLPHHRSSNGLTWAVTTQKNNIKSSSALSDQEPSSKQEDTAQNKVKIKPDILKPYPPAMDPMYSLRGAVGENNFTVSRYGEPTLKELSNENIVRIVRIQCSDLEANTLVWKCLGYRFDAENEIWNNDQVFPNWKEKHPTPPDFIGMQRVYSKEVDQPSLRANQGLVRSVPVEYKQSLKKHLKPLGFRGYQFAELTPNKTRRAQVANWLLFYRESLFGYTLEELRERRRLKKEAEERAKIENPGKEEWKPPVREVF